MGSKHGSINDILLLGVFYLVAHGGILLIPNAIFWDDWIYYRADPSIIFDISRQIGWMFNLFGYMHVAMLGVGPWVYKAFTFSLMFVAGLMLWLILRRYPGITKDGRFFIVLLFLLLPFNMARVALVDFHYTLCFFLFFLAWALMDRFRVVALALFFLSFNTNSLLVFYVAPVLDMFYRGGHLSSLKLAVRFSLRRVDYMLLPFVYFLVKVYYFSPSGIYHDYNEGYGISHLMRSPVDQVYDLFSVDVNVGLCLILSLFVFWLISKKSLAAIQKGQSPWLLPVTGAVIFCLGAFPYWILGHVPTFHEWTSRHQLLLPLGSALIIVGAFAYNDSTGRLGVMSIIIGASLAFNVSTYAALFVDWQKQKRLTSLFAKNQSVEHAGLIVVDDRSERINALDRIYRFYEWNGILEAAFGNQRRFAVPLSQLDDYLAGKLDVHLTGPYKAKSFQKNAPLPVVLVQINLIKPDRDDGMVMARFYPRFVLSASVIDLENFGNKGAYGY